MEENCIAVAGMQGTGERPRERLRRQRSDHLTCKCSSHSKKAVPRRHEDNADTSEPEPEPEPDMSRLIQNRASGDAAARIIRRHSDGDLKKVLSFPPYPGEFLHPVVYACTAVMLLCLFASIITYIVHHRCGYTNKMLKGSEAFPFNCAHINKPVHLLHTSRQAIPDSRTHLGLILAATVHYVIIPSAGVTQFNNEVSVKQV
ncbi:unnamed protein product [Menidia menidia]|uniref:(Atlantic silverside) hypothetical protein n=1 Tax=Menidia menidia TaxID=238744 RepID=A0A8S4BYL1_9TELE|nr:unnamed protein product [Menidia menidia]